MSARLAPQLNSNHKIYHIVNKCQTNPNAVGVSQKTLTVDSKSNKDINSTNTIETANFKTS